MAAMHLKSKRKHFFAKFLQVMVVMSYIIPSVYTQCILKRNQKFKDHAYETEIRRWFFLEENLFIS